MSSDPVIKRTYDATSRRATALQTRERICAVAEELFLRDGFARTTIRSVAQASGVSEATIYLTFATKGTLLDAVIVRATRDNPAERLDAVAAAPPHEILRRFAASNAALMCRAARLIALGESASLMDAELRPLRDRAHGGLRAAFAAIAERLDGAGLLRVSTRDAASTLYAIATETTYLRMTEAAALDGEDYALWLADALAAALLHPDQPPGW
jgi:AcrR family transcriptional regulator